ncbi:hypothetical protein K466DRAFT_668311 [Polyporus arcularius HHB13444]|uniref:Uncharacterized protein n=1 Tax=Polyporus arcularius HHB13444 TaxID=1314778 RepID=A0A5C3NR55_9APHY|nr:hypothetical protein K466DRAFT_668311 [Polyporus arcularius HHB13444]
MGPRGSCRGRMMISVPWLTTYPPQVPVASSPSWRARLELRLVVSRAVRLPRPPRKLSLARPEYGRLGEPDGSRPGSSHH